MALRFGTDGVRGVALTELSVEFTAALGQAAGEVLGTDRWVLGRDIELSSELAAEARRAASLTRAAEDARLIAIRQHLDPHFLFNTLGAIAEWCREDPVVAERALLELSAMLHTLFEGIRAPL